MNKNTINNSTKQSRYMDFFITANSLFHNSSLLSVQKILKQEHLGQKFYDRLRVRITDSNITDNIHN